jgi:hypothetical protein
MITAFPPPSFKPAAAFFKVIPRDKRKTSNNASSSVA